MDALAFTAEMYGLQLDQLAAVLGVSVERARGVALRWRNLGLAESARLGPGPPWIWASRPGLGACGLRYTAVPPTLSRLAHIRAVTAVRLALQATTAYQRARAFWRSERRIRAGSRLGMRDHLPDGELHWPTEATLSWAGECWAIQAELTAVPRPKPLSPAGRPGTPGRSTSAPPPCCPSWSRPGTSLARSVRG